MARHSVGRGTVAVVDILERFKWLEKLKERALTHKPTDTEVACFPAPRASVVQLCTIAQAAIQLVHYTDLEHDEHSPEGARAAKQALEDLVRAVR